MKLLETVRREMPGFVGFKFLPVWFAQLLIKTGLLKYYTKFFKYSARSLESVLLEVVPHNAKLRAVLAYSYGDYGTLPKDAPFSMHAVLTNHFLLGVAYPVGGSSEIAFNIHPTIEAAGGMCLVRAEVNEIIVENGSAVGVCMKKDNHQIYAPIIVSAAGIFTTFDKLLNKPRIGDNHKLHVQHGWGGMSVFIGLKGTAKDLKVRANNTWAFLSENLQKDAEAYISRSGKECGKSPIPLLFISFPSTKDPTWEKRFPGVTTCQIITLARWEWFQEWEGGRVMHRGKDYEERKNELGKMMWSQTCKLHPSIKGKEIYFNVGTPLTNKFYLAAQAGEMYGCDHNVARFSPEATCALRPEVPELPGLFLSGQDVFSCGFAGATFGGLLAASKILNRNLYADLMDLKAKSPREVKSE